MEPFNISLWDSYVAMTMRENFNCFNRQSKRESRRWPSEEGIAVQSFPSREMLRGLGGLHWESQDIRDVSTMR